MDIFLLFIFLPVLRAAPDCLDVNSDCADYGHDYICNGDYIPWSKLHCKKFCKLCLLDSIAAYKPATQSSNYAEGRSVWVANTAVDGDATCEMPPTSQHYSATDSGLATKTSWWRVDLGTVYAINQVIVHGMPVDKDDQLTGFTLYLTKQRVDNPDVSLSVYNNTDYGNGTFDIHVSEEARYVLLRMPGPGTAIVLCEVEVYGSVAAIQATTTLFPMTSAINLTATTTTVISMCPAQVEQRAQPQYLFQYREKCYEFVPSNDSWMHAREDCHSKGGYLLSIKSADEQAFISNVLTTINFTQQLWIGLDDRVNEEQWNWDSGDSVNYINWIPGRYVDQYHDQEDCAIIDASQGGSWDDVDCNAVVSGGVLSYPWICQYDRQAPGSNSTLTVPAGGWSSWFYGSCSVICGTGMTHRVRSCSTGHSVDCTGKDFESVSCDAGPCPIDGSWSSWQQWSTCSTTCDDGIRIRLRNCDNPTPQHGGKNCSGTRNETIPCHLIDCPPSWSSWFYGTCTVTCGLGTISRLRRCSTGCESDCPGNASGIAGCIEGSCPIDGSWSNWHQWSTCSTTCGDGRRLRERDCNNPSPQHSGMFCRGPINETSACNLEECPHWLPFYETSACSASCGTGYIQLRRNCSSGNPHDCPGSEYGEKSCNLMNCSY